MTPNEEKRNALYFRPYMRYVMSFTYVSLWIQMSINFKHKCVFKVHEEARRPCVFRNQGIQAWLLSHPALSNKVR